MRLKTVRLVVLLALVSLTAPLNGHAQGLPAEKVYRIGFLRQGQPPQTYVEAFQHGLRERGYVEGQHVVVEYRFDGSLEQLPQLAEELVRLPVDVLLVPNVPAALAAKQATTTIPVVLVGVSDPVGNGLVASLARPGGNITGVAVLQPEVVGKQLEFLKDVLPTVSRVAVLRNPANPAHARMVREADGAAQALGVQLHLLEARGPEAFDSAFAAMTKAHAGALLVFGDAMLLQHRSRLADLAAASHLLTMYNLREFVEAGGLLSYGTSLPDTWRRAATYVDKILKGAKPADLPVEQPTKFELVINLKTAQALGLTMPPSLLLLADEVIQ
jgi:putative tryptophan/tyrosine transport system substrate-binding protein